MLSIILQAGGESSRMGRDKALLPFLGIPLIQRLRDRFQKEGAEILVITNDFSGYEDLGLPLSQDLIPGRGALGGLYTALSISSYPLVGLIAADMPFASPQLIHQLADLILTTDYDGIIPSTQNGIEPMHAVYRRETCLPPVKDALEAGLWRLISWHEQANILIIDPEETRLMTGNDYTFLNLNTPEEFKAAEELARSLE
jgi:molybdopterin-guanine dinucleotide biosynthesis protein A